MVADVFLFDLLAGAKRRLTDGPAARQDLQLAYPYLVWRENPQWQAEPDTGWHIILYHLPSAEVRTLTTTPAARRQLQLAGSRLVWLEDHTAPAGPADTGWDLYAYDLASDHLFPITTAPGVQRYPLLTDDLVVWADHGPCALESGGPEELPLCAQVDMDLYAYAFSSRETTRVAAHVGARGTPDLHVHGTRVVWEQVRADGTSEIRLRDLTSARELRVSTVRQTHTRPQIYGDYLFWTERVTCDAIDLGNLAARVQAGAFVYQLETGRKRRISSAVEPLVRVHGSIAFLTEGCMYQTRLYAVWLAP